MGLCLRAFDRVRKPATKRRGIQTPSSSCKHLDSGICSSSLDSGSSSLDSCGGQEAGLATSGLPLYMLGQIVAHFPPW